MGAQQNSTFQQKNTVEQLEAVNQRMEEWSETHRGYAYKLPCCDDFTLENFNGLLPWLGITGCSYLQVVHANVTRGTQRQATILGRSCQAAASGASPGTTRRRRPLQSARRPPHPPHFGGNAKSSYNWSPEPPK